MSVVVWIYHSPPPAMWNRNIRHKWVGQNRILGHFFLVGQMLLLILGGTLCVPSFGTYESTQIILESNNTNLFIL